MKILKSIGEKLYTTYFFIKEKLLQKIYKDIDVILVGEKHNSFLHTKLKDLLIKIYDPEAVLYECPKNLSTSGILKLIEIFAKRFKLQNLLNDYNFKELIENSLDILNIDKETSLKIKKEIEEIIKEYNKDSNKKISMKNNLYLDLSFLEFCDFISYLRFSLLDKCYSNEREKYKICDNNIFPNLFENLKKYLDIDFYFFAKNYLPTFRTFEKIAKIYKKNIICVDDYKLEDKYIRLIKKFVSDSEAKEILTEYHREASSINKEREKIMAEEIVKYINEMNLQNKKAKLIFIGGKLHIQNIENYLRKHNIKTRKIMLPEMGLFSNKIEDDFQYLISLIKN